MIVNPKVTRARNIFFKASNVVFRVRETFGWIFQKKIWMTEQTALSTCSCWSVDIALGSVVFHPHKAKSDVRRLDALLRLACSQSYIFHLALWPKQHRDSTTSSWPCDLSDDVTGAKCSTVNQTSMIFCSTEHYDEMQFIH